jgi:cytochrome c oxidase subunit 4
MSDSGKNHIVSYKTYLIILLVLLIFTALSIIVTSFELGPLAVSAALLFATLKTTLVFMYFMHLKFDQPVYAIMVSIVLFVFVAVVVITFLDYSFR